ncbi:MAG: hypothetical protein AB7J13_14730 [Pyrinomonadaceae bacterium]
METAAYLLYILADWSLIVLAPAIIMIVVGSTAGIGLMRRLRAKRRAGSAGAFVILAPLLGLGMLFIIGLGIVLVAFFALSLFRPHYLDGDLIYRYGKKADAKVISVEDTKNMLNYERVKRYNVIYNDESGIAVETNFETWDFNVYPSANSVRYPGVGQTFKISYLPSYPHVFMILTDEESPYVMTNECREILAKIEEAKNRYEFDKKNTKNLFAYMNEITKGIEKKCGDHLFDNLKSLNDDYPPAKK